VRDRAKSAGWALKASSAQLDHETTSRMNDPYGRGRAAVERAADELWHLTDHLVRLLHTR